MKNDWKDVVIHIEGKPVQAVTATPPVYFYVCPNTYTEMQKAGFDMRDKKIHKNFENGISNNNTNATEGEHQT